MTEAELAVVAETISDEDKVVYLLVRLLETYDVLVAGYLRNRSPSSGVGGITPHQTLYGQKPCVGHLRVFGCTAFIHVPKDERGKLDSKTRKCILLGYGSLQKGY